MASEWVGGNNWIKVPRGSKISRHGGTNDGTAKKKYGDAGMKNRARFNPNPTRSSHPGCVVAIKSKEDKEKYVYSQRPVKIFTSGLN